MIALAQDIAAHPEPGFEESRTSAKVAKGLEALGLDVVRGIAVTGLKATRQFGRIGPTVGVIGELDALRVPGHSLADPDTSAAHACGHHTQPAQLLGVAAALSSPEVADHLGGSVAFIATPAEEFIDLGRRLERREAGELGFMSGKQEMIRLGTFDDVDMAMMVHTSSEGEPGKFSIGGTSNAHVVHMVKFKGKAAHAGGAPWDGVNALQAANVAMLALNTQRETFRNSDTIRVHGIITSAGISMNAVPAEVVYEGRVRGRNSEIVDATAVKVERCFKAGALALGAEVEITSVPGYMALVNDPVMGDLFAANVDALSGPGTALRRGAAANRGGSTDMGDLSQIMPVIHPYVNAATGTAHGVDYLIEDYYSAVVTSASALAMTVIDLLAADAANAKTVLKEAKPPMTRVQYVSAQRARMRVTRYKGR
ncbi:MAG: amidohydrolase [Chloroflexi bacterium]|nr:amidohydrolase [Chloroflexota bacterium]